MSEDRVAKAFARADDYDRHARVQRDVAAWVAREVAIAAPMGACVLEIGCGTGFVAEEAARQMRWADWLMTDIAPEMVARARKRLAHLSNLRFAVADGERLELAGEPPCDILCSSLAVQWFADLPAALARLFAHVRPGGSLIVATLAAGTFAEWRAAHAALGLSPGTPDYPDGAALAAMRLDGVGGEVTLRTFIDRHEDGAAFLRALRAIGAGTPRAGHRALGPAALRQVVGRFEQAGAVGRYEVALLRFDRP